MTLLQRIAQSCAALGLAAALALTPAHSSQAPIVTPTAGPHSMADFTSNYLNPALQALASCFSGSAAPADGPGALPLQYQCWVDTTSNPSVYKFWDGTNWVAFGALNTSTHAWTSRAGAVNSQTANYTLQASDCGGTVQLGTGSTGFFTVTVPSVSGFSTSCPISIVNGDTARGKGMPNSLLCSSAKVLWPSQSCTIAIINGAWAAVARPGPWHHDVGGTLNLFSDYVNGVDIQGNADGLGADKPFKTAQNALIVASDQIDWNSQSQTQVVVNMAAATADLAGLHLPFHSLSRAQGGAAMQVAGASLAVSGAVTNGGLCKITVPSTATYSANELVSVYGVGGATGCNGPWAVTVTDGTHLTLQGTTFGGAYTSGGTVTNGSSFVTSGDAVDTYFDTVVQFSNVNFNATNGAGLGVSYGSFVYLLSGNIFSGSTSGVMISINSLGTVEVDNSIGFAPASSPYAFLSLAGGGILIGGGAPAISIEPGLALGLNYFVLAQGGNANFGNWTISTNGSTITGARCAALGSGSNITSATGNANTFFPGSSPCQNSGGGSVDTVTGELVATNNLSDLTSAVAARTNLGLAALATTAPGAGVATALGNGANTSGGIVTSPAAVANGGTGTTTTASERTRLEQGMTLLNVLTASNSAVLSDTTSFSASYDDYLLVFDNLVPVSNAVEPQLLVHSGGAFQSTGYLNVTGGATTYVSLSSGAATVFNGAGTGMSGPVTISNVNSTAVNKLVSTTRMAWYSAAGTLASQIGNGYWNGSQGAIDGFQFQWSSGNIATGSIKIYGLRNAL